MLGSYIITIIVISLFLYFNIQFFYYLFFSLKMCFTTLTLESRHKRDLVFTLFRPHAGGGGGVGKCSIMIVIRVEVEDKRENLGELSERKLAMVNDGIYIACCDNVSWWDF